MLEIKAKLKIPRSAYRIEVKGQLKLPFESRRKSRLHTQLVSGEDVALLMPRGEILRGGDLVTASDGRVIEVVAEIEPLIHVECEGLGGLSRAAYHLGNRQVPVEVGEGYLRLMPDHALEEVLKGLGAKLSRVDAPFEPEARAPVGTNHAHPDNHDDGHVHGEHCGHDRSHHGHDHKH